jgi:ribonuclease P protein component
VNTVFASGCARHRGERFWPCAGSGGEKDFPYKAAGLWPFLLSTDAFLMMAQYQKLKRNADFGRVYRRGRYYAGRFVVLHTLPNRSCGPARVGFTVSRRIGGAVQRNRVKRRLREVMRTLDAEMRTGVDLVLTAKPNVENTVFEKLKAEVYALLARAGLLAVSS